MPPSWLAARIYGIGLVGFFVGATILSLILTSFSAGRTDRQENRSLAAVPGLPRSIPEWQSFPTRFEAFVDDNFRLRKALLRLNTRIMNSLLRQPLTAEVVQGPNGWLFYAGNNSLELYRNERPLSAQNLSDWRIELTQRKTWLAARNVGYVFVVPPDKHTIYPEYMPSYYWRRDRPSQYDQFMAMAQEADLPVVDLRPALLKEKPNGLLYLEQDTHWNQWGGYIGYRATMAAVAKVLDVEPVEMKRSDLPIIDVGRGDLARLAGLSTTQEAPSITEDAYQCQFTTTDEPVTPTHPTEIERLACPDRKYKVLVFRDSFAESMTTYIAETFGEGVLIWKQVNFNEFQTYVAQEKPDLVIEERVERFLQYAPDHASQ